jgi:hypothetical protein
MIDLGTLWRIYEYRVIDEFIIGGRATLKPDHPNPGALAKYTHYGALGKDPVAPGRQLAAEILRRHDGLQAIGEVPNVLLMVKGIRALQAVIHHGLGKGQKRLVG